MSSKCSFLGTKHSVLPALFVFPTYYPFRLTFLSASNTRVENKKHQRFFQDIPNHNRPPPPTTNSRLFATIDRSSRFKNACNLLFCHWKSLTFELTVDLVQSHAGVRPLLVFSGSSWDSAGCFWLRPSFVSPLPPVLRGVRLVAALSVFFFAVLASLRHCFFFCGVRLVTALSFRWLRP